MTFCEPKTRFIIISYSTSDFREILELFFYFKKLLIRSNNQGESLSYATFTDISIDYGLLQNTSTAMFFLILVMSYTDIFPEMQFCRRITPKDSAHLSTLSLFP